MTNRTAAAKLAVCKWIRGQVGKWGDEAKADLSDMVAGDSGIVDADALEGALGAARMKGGEPASTDGIPTPEESGFPSEIHIQRGEN